MAEYEGGGNADEKRRREIRSSVSLSSWKDFEYNDQILGDLLENDSILANT